MEQWVMLTLVGKDRIGIVASLTDALYQGGCHLGEASMIRLGGNFTVMLMVKTSRSIENIKNLLTPMMQKLNLQLHIDPIEGELHQQYTPNVRVSVHGADRAGIVAQVTATLAETGFNIVDLESDVGGTEDHPFYIMHIEGVTREGIEKLRTALQVLSDLHQDIEVHVTAINAEIF